MCFVKPVLLLLWCVGQVSMEILIKTGKLVGGGTAAGLQIRNDRVTQMREEPPGAGNMTCLDFFCAYPGAHIGWSYVATRVCVTVVCLQQGFGDGQPPWQTSVLRLYHMLVFLVHPCWRCWLVISWNRKFTLAAVGSLVGKLYQIDEFSIYRLDCLVEL